MFGMLAIQSTAKQNASNVAVGGASWAIPSTADQTVNYDAGTDTWQYEFSGLTTQDLPLTYLEPDTAYAFRVTDNTVGATENMQLSISDGGNTLAVQLFGSGTAGQDFEHLFTTPNDVSNMKLNIGGHVSATEWKIQQRIEKV